MKIYDTKRFTGSFDIYVEGKTESSEEGIKATKKVRDFYDEFLAQLGLEGWMIIDDKELGYNISVPFYEADNSDTHISWHYDILVQRELYNDVLAQKDF